MQQEGGLVKGAGDLAICMQVHRRCACTTQVLLKGRDARAWPQFWQITIVVRNMTRC
jgi:hypothetical protein